MQLNHFKRVRRSLYSILCLTLIVSGGFTFGPHVAAATTPRSENFEGATAGLGTTSPQTIDDWTYVQHWRFG